MDGKKSLPPAKPSLPLAFIDPARMLVNVGRMFVTLEAVRPCANRQKIVNGRRKDFRTGTIFAHDSYHLNPEGQYRRKRI